MSHYDESQIIQIFLEAFFFSNIKKVVAGEQEKESISRVKMG